MFTYKDRVWCSRAKDCIFKPCDRRLDENDRKIIKDKDLLISFNSFLDCKDFKQKEKK